MQTAKSFLSWAPTADGKTLATSLEVSGLSYIWGRISELPHLSCFSSRCLLGSSEVYCQTSNHYQSGMRGHYSVQQCGKKKPFLGRRYEMARTVYIMAEEVDWDYAPDRSWELERHNSSAEER